jgi:hypothetical protein
MVERGGGFGFGLETADLGLTGELAGEDHLQGDRTVER